VEVKRLNEQVKRNSERFPENFRFQLNDNEFYELVAICDRFKVLKHSSTKPYAFTEQGVSMLSAVLRSDIAVRISVQIIRAFVAMRKIISTNTGLLQRVEGLEQKQIETDKKIDKIFDALEDKNAMPKCGIFFNGQIFDAYAIATKIIKSAKESITLIDNYIDESVLTMLAKNAENVKITLLTKEISKQLSMDIVKFNQQYPPIEAKTFSLSHDRFLIIDEKDVYHLGASLKDLGKKWFAFSKIEMEGLALLEKVKFAISTSL
jgi:hypothetical protein